ncbi:MAG: hypothetical protein LBJ62_07990 [Bifidobacteriaceae bacterium]|nr:hypothetical protein [Bifidobacteriaceae bacterium]
MTATPSDQWDQALEELLEAEPDQSDETKFREVAVLVFDVSDKRLLAALLKGPQIAARTLAFIGGGVAVLDHSSEADSLEAARAASSALPDYPICLLHRGPSEDPAAGEIQARCFLGGADQGTIGPGLVLAPGPQLLEDLLIDPQAADKALEEAVDVSTLGAAEAMRIITRHAAKLARLRRRRDWRADG